MHMETSLKVLMIGSDRKLFEEGSAVAERIKEYGKLVGELHIVVFALSNLGLKEKQLASNVWIYPTNSISRWFFVRDAAKLGKKVVRARSFVRGRSLVTTQDPFESGWAGLKVKKKWRLPLEVQLHTDPFSPYFSGPLNFIRKIIAKRVLRRADSIRVVSESIKDSLLATSYLLPTTKVSVLPILVDKEKIETAPLAFDLHARYLWRFIILTVSRLSPEKNLGLAIETLKLVREKFPNTGLLIVGSGPEEKSLRSKVRSLKLEGAVEFVGWQENLASYYKTANVFLQTSLFEGYGMSLVEAGLSGLPVVTTPVGFAKELEHGKDAYVLEPRAELLAEGIADLLEHNQKRENLRINLKNTLANKLLSKEEYMARINDNWEQTSRKVGGGR